MLVVSLEESKIRKYCKRFWSYLLSVCVVVPIVVVIVVLVVLVLQGLALHVVLNIEIVLVVVIIVVLIITKFQACVCVAHSHIVIGAVLGSSLTSDLVGFLLALNVRLGKVTKINNVLSTVTAARFARAADRADGEFSHVLGEDSSRLVVVIVVVSSLLSVRTIDLSDGMALVEMDSVVNHPSRINFILLENTSALDKRLANA
jgi:hypothetical protein